MTAVANGFASAASANALATAATFITVVASAVAVVTAATFIAVVAMIVVAVVAVATVVIAVVAVATVVIVVVAVATFITMVALIAVANSSMSAIVCSPSAVYVSVATTVPSSSHSVFMMMEGMPMIPRSSVNMPCVCATVRMVACWATEIEVCAMWIV